MLRKADGPGQEGLIGLFFNPGLYQNDGFKRRAVEGEARPKS
jgi:hypothetical protein